MKRLLFLGILFLGLVLLTACQLPAPADEEIKPEPQEVFTAAAQTAAARRTQMAVMTSTPTASPSPIPPTPTITWTRASITATLPSTAVPTGLVTTAAGTSNDRAEFVGDVNIPGGTVFAPGEDFIKTWRLRNVGTTSWTTDYSLVYISGDLMDAPLSVPLPKAIAPGEEVDATVDFVAPSEPGNYRSYWKLRSADGEIFGVGINSEEAFWVDIVVQNALALGDTTTPDGGLTVASVTISADNSEFSGSCPHTFVFTAQLTLNRPATVTYNWEAENNAGVQIKLPSPVTRNLEAGTHSAVFELTFAQSLTGWARLLINAPEENKSNRATFTLSCQ